MSVTSDFNLVSKNIILFGIKNMFNYCSKKKSLNDKLIFFNEYDGIWDEIFEDSKLLITSSVIVQRMKLKIQCDEIFEIMVEYIYDKLNGIPKKNPINEIQNRLIPNTQIHILENHSFLDELIGQELSGQIKNQPNFDNVIKAINISKDLKIGNKIDKLINYLKFLSLAKEEYGTINSLTCPNLPGFAVISYNNPPILILEQLIHESTHINFDINMVVNIKFSEFIKSIPPIFSPIVAKPRTYEKFMTGYLAYLNVFNLWFNISGIKNSDITNELFSNNNVDEIYHIIDNRLQNLIRILTDCALQLDICIPEAKRNSIKYCLNEMMLISNDYKKIKTSKKKSNLNIRSHLDNNIEYAELLLGSKGFKVSRIGRNIGNSVFLNDWALTNNLPCYFSSFSLKNTSDEKLNGFSNIEGERIKLDNSSKDSDIYFYCGVNSEEVINCALKDEQGKAGAFYEIPDCCRNFFKENWEKAVQYFQGDLAKMLMKKELDSKKVKVFNKECNVFAMYFGNGPTWHFPCKFNCEKTIEIIKNRMKNLKTIDYKLHTIFENGMKHDILWSNNHGVGQIKIDKYNDIRIDWLGGKINNIAVIKMIKKSSKNNNFKINNNHYKTIQWQ